MDNSVTEKKGYFQQNKYMYFIYDLILYVMLILLSPYFFFKALFVGKYRHGMRERFGFIDGRKLSPLKRGRVVWFHAVSVGEAKAAMPLIMMLKERHPEIKVLFSTVTATGKAIASKEGIGLIDSLIYYPLDLSRVVKRVVKRLRPVLFIMIEKEIWPNLIITLNRRGIPAIVVNGTISDGSFRNYRRFGFLFKRVFEGISSYCAQSDMDSKRASILGVRRTLVTGNMKFDIVMPSLDEKERCELRAAIGVKNGEPVLVAGSTHRGEEEMIVGAYMTLLSRFHGLRLVIAPRHPERFGEVSQLVNKMGFPLLKRSDTLKHALNIRERTVSGFPGVILLDTMGELSRFYAVADIVFVGGSLVDGVGGHNLLEPAIYKRPVIYGPYLGSWKIVAEMLEAQGGGIKVEDKDSFVESVARLLNDTEYVKRVAEAAYNAACENRGATGKSLQVVEEFLAGAGSSG